MPPLPTYGSIPRVENDNGSDSQPTTTTLATKRSLVVRSVVVMAVAVLVAVGIVAFHKHHGPLVDNPNLLRYSDTKTAKSSSESSSSSSSFISFKHSSSIPFPYIDRSEYSSTPASEIVNPDLFSPELRRSSSSSSSSSSSGSNRSLLTVPFPTGAFWTNLVLVQATSDQGLSYPIMTYPYAYKWSSTLLQISYPPLRRLMDQISIRDIFNPDLTVSVVEDVQTRHVTAFDPLSVTLRYTVHHGRSNDDYWATYLVQGSPYITVKFDYTTPKLSALSIFKSFDCLVGQESNCEIVATDQTTFVLRGTHFQLTSQEQLTWLIIASDPISLSYDAIHKTTIASLKPYQGILRMTLLPPPRDYDKPESLSLPFPSAYPPAVDGDSSTALQRLVCHADVYPVGAKVTWELGNGRRNKDVATVHFRFQTKALSGNSRTTAKKNRQPSGCDSGNSELLMLALPHHVQILPTKTMLLHNKDFDMVFRTIKGVMVPIVGDVWSFQEPLTTIGFDTEKTLKNAQALDDNTKTMILQQVREDMSRVLPVMDENVYGFGKQVARLAQLAHIASVLEDPNSNQETKSMDSGGDSLTVALTKVLHSYLSAYLTGQIRDKLLYDTDFGGIVSVNGLKDFMDDFGNGWYNDHLFHYGYIMYASAVLGKLNSTFVDEMGDAVDAILLDVANPANADSQQSSEQSTPHDLFPFTRHKSWFDSHSFASGLFPFADGKSMESSGESVNFYYGAYLWTTVRTSGGSHQPNTDLVDWTRLLLAMEVRGVQTYWHMVATGDPVDAHHASDIYNPQFAKNLMVGNVGMMDVTIATWFGTESLYVHMINFLPVTAITKELFDISYVKEEFKNIISPVYDHVEMAWKGYVVSDRAMIEPSGAWEDALNLRSYELDQAISQSQVMYFASTMDGFVAPETPPTKGPGGAKTNGGEEDSGAACDQHEACAVLELMGDCCPSVNGIFLGCCGISSPPSRKGTDSNVPSPQVDSPPSSTKRKSDDATAAGESSSSCADHKACVALRLTGICCPTSDGTKLGCCT